MRTGVPCNENWFFPVRIDLQGVPCKPYKVWVYSVHGAGFQVCDVQLRCAIAMCHCTLFVARWQILLIY